MPFARTAFSWFLRISASMFYISIASKVAVHTRAHVCVCVCDPEPVLSFTKAHAACRTFKSFFYAHNNGKHNKQNTLDLEGVLLSET
jgi:hypothetical protein